MTRSPLRARELTARGRGAISVLALEGPEALERVRALARAPALVSEPFAIVRLCITGSVAGNAELLDEALVVIESPERLELHLHGSPPILRRLLSELGAELSTELPCGLEERAEEALARSASEAAARVLLDQTRGALRRELEHLLTLEGAPYRTVLEGLVLRGRVARALVRPPQVVLSGPVNAGKSTLFNALVGRERVVVDPAAGTTRDAVRERVLLGAYAVDVIDTAGERTPSPGDPGGALERAGQELSARLQAEADLVLVLAPQGSVLVLRPLPPGSTWIRRVLRSRADGRAPLSGEPDAPALSALQDPARARAVVEETFHLALGLPREPWRSGEGVPFFEELQRELETAQEADPIRSRTLLGAWL